MIEEKAKYQYLCSECGYKWFSYKKEIVNFCPKCGNQQCREWLLNQKESCNCDGNCGDDCTCKKDYLKG